MTADKMRLLPPTREVPPSEDSGLRAIRDNLAHRHPTLDLTAPAVLDLAARGHAAAHAVLKGAVAQMGGPHSEDFTRKALRGVANISLVDFAAWALHGAREPRVALLDVLNVLAQALGHRLEPIDPATLNAKQAAARCAQAGGDLVAETLTALEDDHLSPEEAEALEDNLRAQEAATAAMRAACNEARARTVARQAAKAGR